MYQLNFTVFMYVTQKSRYITLYYRSVLSVVSRNRGSSWNVLPRGYGGSSVYAIFNQPFYYSGY